MKELSIEEKAKRYDEALPQLNGLLDGVHEEKCDIMEEDIIKIFPELKESDDERIRKSLLYVIEHHPTLPTEEAEEYIAWLEKQGEQKSVTEKPVFEIGEKITDGTSTFTIVSIKDEHYIADDGDNVCFYVAHKYYTPFKEQKPAEWSEEDAEMINYIASILYSNFNENEKFDNNKPCVGALVDWLKSLKDRVQPKQEWSEKDEINLKKAIWYVENPAPMVVKDSMLVEWLKSLKHKSTWKPSDVQIQTLEFIVEYHAFANKDRREDVVALLSDLKKLMEE